MDIEFKLDDNIKELLNNYINDKYKDYKAILLYRRMYNKLYNLYENRARFKKEEILSPIKIVSIPIVSIPIDHSFYEGAYLFHKNDDGVEYMMLIHVKYNYHVYVVEALGIYDLDLFCKYHNLNDEAKASIQAYIELNNETVNFEKLLKIVDSLK